MDSSEMTTNSSEILICEPSPEKYAEITSILDAAALQTDSAQIKQAIEDGDVFVALPSPAEHGEQPGDYETASSETAPVLGAIVLDGENVTAVAVRPNRRGQDIGSALVGTALESKGRLVARFDERVRPFWKSLDFDISAGSESGRYHGTKE